MLLEKQVSLRIISPNLSFWPPDTQCTDIHVHTCISLTHIQYSFYDLVVLESESKLLFLKPRELMNYGVQEAGMHSPQHSQLCFLSAMEIL